MDKTTTTQIALKWGAIAGVLQILISACDYIFSLSMNGGGKASIPTIGLILIAIVTLILAMKNFKSVNSNFMTYGQGLGIGALMGTIAGLLTSAFSTVYIKYIDTEYQQRMMDMQMAKMEEQGFDSAQMEAAIEMSKKFSNVGITFVSVVLIMLLIYFIFSLIIAAFQRNEKPVFD